MARCAVWSFAPGARCRPADHLSRHVWHRPVSDDLPTGPRPLGDGAEHVGMASLGGGSAAVRDRLDVARGGGWGHAAGLAHPRRAPSGASESAPGARRGPLANLDRDAVLGTTAGPPLGPLPR